MSSMQLNPVQRQSTALSPRLQHAVRLLQMSALEFNQQVQAAVAENPFLDEDEPIVADTTELPDAAAAPEAPEPDDAPAWNDDREFSGPAGEEAMPSDSGASSIDRMPLHASLADHLHGQIDLLNLPARDRVLAKAIVESLDDDGYLRLPLEELTDAADLLPPIGIDELRIALRRVQSLEPAGVAARDLTECLLLQLGSVACPLQRELMALIIRDRLEAVARQDPALLAQQLHQPLDDVAAAVAGIRRLDPRPGWRFGAADIHYIAPDVVVRRGRKGWNVVLNPSVVPRVRLHEVYAEMYQRERRHANAELAAQLRDARWTVRNIEQRFATILGVAQAIVKRQPLFFEHGPLGMKPLALKTIADDVGIHESTVCRVTHNKFMATPSGVFELKYFFSRAMTSTAGTEVSGTAIRRLVREMLDGESDRAPLSDAEITRRLATQGFVLSRRTVTKYRLAMQVGTTRQRRKAA